MSQLSLFSADARPPRMGDLAGLLCGPGQIVRFGAGDQARLSVVLLDPERAPAVMAACSAVGVPMQRVSTDSGATVLRTAFRCDLVGLAREWTHEAVKSVPAGWQLDGASLRLWALAAGRPDERGGYLLSLDPGAPQTHQPLIAAATRAGIPPARVSEPASSPLDTAARRTRPTSAGEEAAVSGGPALRISGPKRVQRLVEMVGPVPARVPTTDWPRYWGRNAS